ncbi:type II toxin-antitoxin system MqsA family antitoxin (plasmid) [Rhizobium ruizarguesonis]|nr:type II toxin-antitoxin system MqsA family antitoxin [Rhizobium ruizarguesonis]
MAVAEKIYPETMVSPETGETLHRDVRPFVVTYRGKSITVELPGYYPESGDEGVHVVTDMAVTDLALRALKEEIDGVPSPSTIQRIRRKLERGLMEPSGPTSQLLRLLDRHPEMIEELRQPAR